MLAVLLCPLWSRLELVDHRVRRGESILLLSTAALRMHVIDRQVLFVALSV